MAPKQPVAGPSRPKPQLSAQAPPPPPSLGAFNPSRTRFALALPVLGSADKVTVWDVDADRAVAAYEIEGAAKATTLSWASAPLDGASSKKRRKGKHTAAAQDMVVITTAKGDLIVFDPEASEVVRKVTLPAPATAAWSSDDRLIVATASQIFVLSQDVSTIANTFSLPSSTQSPSAIALLPTSDAKQLHVLVATLSVSLITLDLASTKSTQSTSPLPVATSAVTSLLPLPSSSSGTSFLVVSSDDRAVSQYTFPPSSPAAQPKLSYRYTSPTLSSVHSLSVSASYLAVLHDSGEISLFPLALSSPLLDTVRPKTDSKPSTVSLVEGKDERQVRICRVAFAKVEAGELGALVCGRMAGGGKVGWRRAVVEGPDGVLVPKVTVKSETKPLAAVNGDANGTQTQRYAAPSGVAVLPPPDIPDEPSMNDVDTVDLPFGERLASQTNGDSHPQAVAPSAKASKKVAIDPEAPVTAGSLTRLLTQALHTSDPALISFCLSNRDPKLIRNTVRKLPPNAALPLLKACIERLGQGKNAAKKGGGRGSGQAEQQGRGTVEWVKGVLVERGAVLMATPSLPLHLAQLSSLLQSRLQLYQPLQNLSGRLDLALAQINMRRLAAEQLEAANDGSAVRKYVEGESSDEEDDDDVEVEQGDEEGEVEDIDMRGARSDEDEDSEMEDGEGDEDEDEDEEEGEGLESGDEDLLELDGDEASEGSGSEEDEED